VVFKADAVQVRIEHLERVITQLDKLRKMGEEALRGDQAQMWAVERGLQLGAEVILDIGNHILSARFGVSAADYKDIVKQLAEHRVIGAALKTRLDGLAGFRNILVHDYVRLDPDKVLSALADAPRDFGDFALTIREWLGSQAR
jgi:uncharacterized protein YutE (UPF0331/DUF86 family)